MKIAFFLFVFYSLADSRAFDWLRKRGGPRSKVRKQLTDENVSKLHRQRQNMFVRPIKIRYDLAHLEKESGPVDEALKIVILQDLGKYLGFKLENG